MNPAPMNEEYYINLIHKQLSGSISLEEQEALEKWRMDSAAHQRRFEEEQLVWELGGRLAEEPENLAIDLDVEFAKLKHRINEEEPSETKVQKLETEKPKALSSISYLAIAASIVLLIGFATLRSLGFLGNSDLLEYQMTNELGQLALADGTEVQVNKHSTLSYPKSFPGNERRVILDGEAFFRVQRNPNKPFIIETQFGEITVLGTAFNVESRSDGKQSMVFVKEGKVKFRNQEGVFVLLEANDMALLDHQSGALEKSSAASANTLAWFTRELNYQNAALSQVLKDLEELHQSNITLSQGSARGCLFSGSFKDQSLSSSLQTLALIYNFEIQALADGSYQLSGFACE